MKIVHQFEAMRKITVPVSLAAGFFDGVHLGHREVLRRAVKSAHESGGQAWAITFDPHPLKVLDPCAAPLLLTSTRHKLELMHQLGIDGCILVHFTSHFAKTSADSFLEKLATDLPSLKHIFVGEDWRFGKSGRGNATMLEKWATSRNIALMRVPPVRYRNEVISSTRIREVIAKGQLQMASTLLGRPFSILGTVTHGNRIGRKLGFPTANIDPQNEVRPPVGVYAVQAITAQGATPGIVNFGYHPTIRAALAPLIELHLLDVTPRLYGKRVEVFFLSRLRSERHFQSTDALVEQIEKDIILARRKLSSAAIKKLWNRTLQTWQQDTIVTPQKTKRKEERE
jgi:riboflavin kinase/FMN adenylyltransferase